MENKKENINKKNGNSPISDVKYSTYSDENYTGHSNLKIKELEKERLKIETRLREIKDEKYKIRSKCIHKFKFVCRGMYEDSYQCSKCGQAIEK